MSTSIATASPWPARAAYFSAAIFTGASGTINVTYGWQKGSDLAGSLTWAAVAAAVAIVFALSWPALIRSLEARRWSVALVAMVALVLSGAYSVTAALGSAAGGRANASTTETAVTDTRKRAQDAYDAAKAELATLKPTRPAAELMAMRDGWRRAYPNQQWVLEPELARAKRRAELEQKIERVAGELTSTSPARQANSDARTLARYLQAFGLNTTPEHLNDLLVLLAVLMIEAGGGLSLALGMALSAPALGEPPADGGKASNDRNDASMDAPGAASRTPAPQGASASKLSVPNPAPGTQSGSVTRPRVSVLDLLRENGGQIHTTTRRLGAQLGRPAATVHTELRRLAGASLIALNSDSRGTRIALLPEGRPNLQLRGLVRGPLTRFNFP